MNFFHTENRKNKYDLCPAYEKETFLYEIQTLQNPDFIQEGLLLSPRILFSVFSDSDDQRIIGRSDLRRTPKNITAAAAPSTIQNLTSVRSPVCTSSACSDVVCPVSCFSV